MIRSEKDVKEISGIINRSGSRIYFIGIGGVSMSALAELLLKRGRYVAGSDVRESPSLKRLSLLGARISTSHSSARLIAHSPDLVVYSLSIREDNPELKAALAMGIPTVSRAELLGAIMSGYKTSVAVSGSHGKTTVTALLSEALSHICADALIGAEISGTGLVQRGGDVIVAEACEYGGSFLKLFPTVFLLLNIDHDHVDHYPSIESVSEAFFEAAKTSRGTVIVNADDIRLRSFSDQLPRVVAFSEESGFDYRYEKRLVSSGRYNIKVYFKDTVIANIPLAIPGVHNAINAVAAVVTAHHIGADMKKASAAIADFSGAPRRLELISKKDGCDVFYDYAHHPCEISATYSALSDMGYKRPLAIFAPHTYSRTKAFLSSFAEALAPFSETYITEIYGARESSIVGVTPSALSEEIRRLGGSAHAVMPNDPLELIYSGKFDSAVLMGAGDLDNIKRKIEDS